MWVKAGEREKNKEKHVNGAMFLTASLEERLEHTLTHVANLAALTLSVQT
jgi:hypothetical protein